MRPFSWAKHLVALFFLVAVSFSAMAQGTVTYVSPGFMPGSEFIIRGSGLSAFQWATVEGVTFPLKEKTDSEVILTVPEDAPVTAAQMFFGWDGDKRSNTQEKVHPVGQVSGTERLLFYEPFVSPVDGRPANNEAIGNTSNFGNKGVVNYMGTGAAKVAWMPEERENAAGEPIWVGFYESFSSLFTVGLGTAESEFTITGINTEGYENIRLAYSLSSWNGQLHDGFEIFYAVDGGDWNSIGNAPVDAVYSKVKMYKNPNQLPATANLSIKFKYNYNDPKNPILVDDIQITGYEEGSANITNLDPETQKVGKWVTVNGARLTDVTKLSFGGIDIVNTEEETNFEVADNGTFVKFKVPAGADMVNDGDDKGKAQVTIHRSAGGDVSSPGLLHATAPETSITMVSPTQGPENGYIYVIGEDLYDVKSIQFNGLDATAFRMVEENKYEVAVPEGASTGKIEVTTANSVGSISSEEDFTINYDFPALSIVVSAEEGNEIEETEIDVHMETENAALSDTQITFDVSGQDINDADYDLDKDGLEIKKGETSSDTAILKILNDGDDFEEEETLILTLDARTGEGAVVGKDRTAEIKIVLDVTTSTGKEINANDFYVAKTGNQLEVTFKKPTVRQAQVGLYGQSGRLIRVEVGSKDTFVLPAPTVSGMYILRVVQDGQLMTKKIFVD